MMMSSKSDKLEEAEKVAELKKQGKSFKEIGEEMGFSKSTAKRRLDTWKAHIGRQEAEEEEIERAEELLEGIIGGDTFDRVRGVVGGILADEDISRKLGEVTGADAGTLKNAISRILEGKATKEEVRLILSNVHGIYRGLAGGSEISKQVFDALPDRESLTEKEEEESEKEKKEKAVVGGSSESESEEEGD